MLAKTTGSSAPATEPMTIIAKPWKDIVAYSSGCECVAPSNLEQLGMIPHPYPKKTAVDRVGHRLRRLVFHDSRTQLRTLMAPCSAIPECPVLGVLGWAANLAVISSAIGWRDSSRKIRMQCNLFPSNDGTAKISPDPSRFSTLLSPCRRRRDSRGLPGSLCGLRKMVLN